MINQSSVYNDSAHQMFSSIMTPSPDSNCSEDVCETEFHLPLLGSSPSIAIMFPLSVHELVY